MRDWKAIAAGVGLDPNAIDRIAGPLNALEQDFRPLAAALTPDIEPVFELRNEAGE